MNVFVLCTGRSGSTSFVKACKHISNFTASHESRSHLLSTDRFAFPDNHIEADNRLCWQLGELDNKYGKTAFYVHLQRDPKKVAQSFLNRFLMPKSMIYAYANGIKKQPPESLSSDERFAICLDYVKTVNTNISLFLKDKPYQISLELNDIQSGFEQFWKDIEAEGDLKLALQEFEIKHNKSPSKSYDLNYSVKHFFLKLKMLFQG